MPSDDLDPVAALAEEFLQRRRAGERLTVADYVDRYPALAGRIRAVFPALLAVADLEPRTTDRTGDVVPARAGDRSPPERIGDYRILREVGRGGMGIVYEAEQESLGRHVALKVLPGHSLLDTARLERFRREAKAAARLHHTNIVPVFGVGEEGGLHYYAMQFIQGQGLDQVLEELRRLRRGGQEGTGESSVHLPGQDPSSSLSEKGLAFWRGVARVGVQVAEALAHAHAQGILHRDVKPSNLLLDTHGTVWVTDFGLAKWEGDSDQLTHTGDIVGTMRYMAPERFDGRADPRSDVCSLGLALYELLTLRPAFDETDRNKLLRQVLHEGPPAPRSLDPTIPRDLETIVLAAIARDPADRYQSAQKMADDLTRFLEDRPLAARRANRAEQFRRWCRRNPALALLTGAVTGLLLVGLVSATLTALHLGRVAEREQGLKVEALVAKGEAEEKAREARQRLAQQYLTHGEGATGSVEGLAWMAEALDLDGDDPGRAATYRLRLRTLMGEAPRPIRAWRKPGVRLPPRPMTHYRHPLAGPDGRFVLLLDSNGQARVWDMEAIRPLGPGPLAGTAVRYGVFTADGKRACTVDTAGTVRVHDTATARPIGSPLLHERGLVLARFSPDGRRLLTWSLRDSLVDDVGLVARLWQVGTGAAPLLLRHPGGVFVADFSPDGRLVVTAGGRTAQLWDAQTGEARGAAMQHRLGVQHAGFTPDGQSLLTTDASAGGASLISTWRVPTGQSLGPVGAPSRHVAVSPDGRLAVGASYNSVGIVDLATRALLCTPPHPQFVFAAHFSQDGTRVLTISEDRAVRVWDPLSGKPLGQPLWHGTAPQHAFFLADGATIRTITEDGMVRDWQLPQGTPTSAFTKGPTGAFTGEGKAVRLAFSKDGRYVAAGTFEATPSVWERASGKRVAQVHHPHWPWHVALSPDGRHLATGGWDGVARVWDVKSGRQVGPDLVHRPRIASLAFSPDGARLLTGATGFPGGARVWDFRSGRAVPGLLPGGRSVSHVEYSPDGARLLTVGSDGARLWDARTGAALPSPTQVEQGQHGNFSPNGLLVVTAHGSTAHVWDTATGQAVGQPLRHAGRVQCVEFSADGSRIATASADQTARIWEARTGRPITPPLRHPANVAEAHFSPDGRYLATASSEGGRIWDTVHGHLLARFPHEGWPGRARFSPDGRQFFLYDLDDQVRFWDWPPPDDGRPSSDLVQQARLLAGHRVDARTGLAPLTGEEFQSAFDALKAKYPADFAPLPPLDRVAWHRRAAQACIRAGNNKAAVLHLDRLLERDGKAAGDWLARSRVHSALGDWKQAGKDAAKAIALGDDSAEAWYLDGRAHHHMRKHKEAVPKLTRAIERDPTLIHAWELRGQARTDLGLWAEGVADNTKAIDLGTKNDWTWYHRGQGRAGLGQLEEAHADMTRSLAGRPKELWWAWDGRGQVAARLGRWQEAAADFARATTDSRASVALWYHLALARLRQGDRDGYRSVCAAAVERFGKDGSDGTRQGLVWMCVVAPDALADRARPLEVLGGKVGPRLPAGRVDLLVLGAALYRAGRFDAATKVLDLAGKARGKGGTAWEELFLALACARRGQAGEARRHLERAKEWIAQAEAGKLTTGRYLWTDRAALGLLQREAEAQLR